MKYDLKNKSEKTSAKGTQYVSATMVDETGKEYQGVNAFHGEFAADTWYGELEQNGKFWNLITPKKSTNNGGAFKSAKIEEAMEKKNQNIAAAQDRSAWMWAKNNASVLLEKQIPVGQSHRQISDAVIALATLIYNGEPTEPFTTPIRPSTELSGQNKVNQHAAEKLFSSGLTDAELDSMADMEF